MNIYKDKSDKKIVVNNLSKDKKRKIGKKKSVENINSFHELANCKEIRNFAEKKKVRLDEIPLKDINKFLKKININNIKIFDVVSSMNSKTSYGGTATKNIKGMIKKYRKEAL